MQRFNSLGNDIIRSRRQDISKDVQYSSSVKNISDPYRKGTPADTRGSKEFLLEFKDAFEKGNTKRLGTMSTVGMGYKGFNKDTNKKLR